MDLVVIYMEYSRNMSEYPTSTDSRWPSRGQAASGYPGTSRDDKSHTDISIGILTCTYIVGETIHDLEIS